MQRSKSSPSLQTIDEYMEYDIKKSTSSPEFNTDDNHIYHFSGSGLLGLQVTNIDGKAVLTNILQNSQAYKKLSIDYINQYYVDRVNDFNFTTYTSIIKFINFIWARDNDISIEFKKYENHIPCKLYQFYEQFDLLDYKEKFYEFGVSNYEDLSYLEYHDLKMFEISDKKIRILCKHLDISVPSTIYLTDSMTIEERQEIIDNNKKTNNIIYIQVNGGWIII